MKQIIIALILVVGTAFIARSYYKPDVVSGGVYSELISASTPEQMEVAFKKLEDIEEYAGTVSKDVSRKAFRITMDLKEKAFKPDSDEAVDKQFAYWTDSVSHLAAISGDVELLRKMSSTYFGSDVAQLKGVWIEKFMQYNPEFFFSLPDTWELWKHAGGAASCCNEPEITVRIIREFYSDTADAERILEDVKNFAFVEEKDTEWAKVARKLLSESEMYW